ncbi:MAG: hypothetical protein ACTIJJ_07040 [Galactobacter sp.]
MTTSPNTQNGPGARSAKNNTEAVTDQNHQQEEPTMNTDSTDLDQRCPDLFECMNDGCSQLRQCLLSPDHEGDHLMESCSPVIGCGVKCEWRPDATDTQARCDQSWLCSNECDQVRYCNLPEGHTQDHEVESCPSREKCPTSRSISDDDAAPAEPRRLYAPDAVPASRVGPVPVSDVDAIDHGVVVYVDRSTDYEEFGPEITITFEEGPLVLPGLDATINLLIGIRDHEQELRVEAVLAGLDPSTLTVQDLARIADTTEFPPAFLRLAVRKLGEDLQGGGQDA